MKTGFHVTENGNILFGRDFPQHLQVAYGRYIARLYMSVPQNSAGIWLRDLPLNLFDLKDMGFTSAIESCLSELSILFYANKIRISDIENSPFLVEFLAFELAELNKPI